MLLSRLLREMRPMKTKKSVSFSIFLPTWFVTQLERTESFPRLTRALRCVVCNGPNKTCNGLTSFVFKGVASGTKSKWKCVFRMFQLKKKSKNHESVGHEKSVHETKISSSITTALMASRSLQNQREFKLNFNNFMINWIHLKTVDGRIEKLFSWSFNAKYFWVHGIKKSG